MKLTLLETPKYDKRALSFTMLKSTANEEEFLSLCFGIPIPAVENMVIGSVIHNSISNTEIYNINNITSLEYQKYIDIHELSKTRLIIDSLNSSEIYRNANEHQGKYEEQIYCIIEDAGYRFQIKGYIDYLDTVHRNIIEFKTTSQENISMLARTIKTYHYDAQLALYNKMVGCKWKGKPSWKTWIIFLNKRTLLTADYAINSATLRIGDKKLEEMLNRFHELVDKHNLASFFYL